MVEKRAPEFLRLHKQKQCIEKVFYRQLVEQFVVKTCLYITANSGDKTELFLKFEHRKQRDKEHFGKPQYERSIIGILI